MKKFKSDIDIEGNLTVNGEPITASAPPEVFVGPSTPTGTESVWVDTDEPASSAGLVPSGGSTGQVLTKASNTSYDVGWAAPSGGVLLLEAGASVPPATQAGTIIYEKTTTVLTTWDFKNLSQLPSGWTRRGVASETFGPTGMTAAYSAGQGHGIAASIGDGEYIEAKVNAVASISSMTGIQVYDGNTGIVVAWYTGPQGCLGLGLNSSWTYNNSYANNGGTPTHPVWFRLSKISGTNWTFQHSTDGATWSSPTTFSGGPQTSTVVGFGCAYSSTATATLETFSMYAGTIGGLRGWWDGAQIVPF